MEVPILSGGGSSGMRSWGTADAYIDKRIGGEAEFGFDSRQMVFRMRIKQLDSGKRVMICLGDHSEWNRTTLMWNISREQGVTVLRFDHSGWEAVTDFFASCNSTWGDLMFRLKESAEGKKPWASSVTIVD